MKSNSLIFLVTTIILASGCQVAGDPNIKHQKLSVDEISNSNQCRLEVNPSAHWLDNFEAANAMNLIITELLVCNILLYTVYSSRL